MAPRIVRPRSDNPLWPVVGGLGLACVAAGYVTGARVFDPGARANADEGAANGPESPATETPEPAHDAGAPAVATHVVPQPVAPQPETPPRVPVRLNRGVTQSCGDGEELNIPGVRCEPVPGAEEAIRHRLERLGDCPAAEAAAANPSAVLSIGLRVDFARHRVTALPGRSSSVRNAMTFVPCARAAFDHSDELWRVVAPHPRYLYFYSVRFGPLSPNARPPAPEAPSETPSTPTPRETPGTPAATPGPSHSTTPSASPTTPGTPAPSANAGTPGTPSAASSTPIHGTPLDHVETVTVVWERVVVRDAPRTGAIVARFNRGEQVTLIARVPGWYEVRLPTGTGWIFGESVGR